MSKLNFINLTVATDIQGKGGIATVLNIYKGSGFFDRWNSLLVATHSGYKVAGLFGSLFLYLIALVKIAFLFTFKRVGVVHIHMSSRGSYIRKSIVLRMAKLLGGKVILHLHSGEFDKFYSQECSEKNKGHIRDSFELADAVIVISSQWLNWAQKTLSRTGHVQLVYNAVPKLQLNRDNINKGEIAFLGRIGQKKGVLDLIHAFAKVKQACPAATLKLAGDGEVDSYTKVVSDLGLTDSVEFLGWISGKEKESLLSSADIYCLPSYNEGFPMGVLEAMSAGVAIVASNAGGIPDAIEHGKEGLLIDAGDVDTLAESLIKLINNRELNETYSQAAKEKFDSCFSTEVIMPQLDALYAELLERKAP